MSSSDRRSFLALIAAAPLAGCGFSPSYGPTGPAQGLRHRIKADPPRSRADFAFVSAFENNLGRTEAPAYHLSYQITVQTVQLAVTPEGAILRYNFVGTVIYTVTDAATGAVLNQGTANSFTASAATRSTIAAASSETDASDRLMQILADIVVTQLIATSRNWVTPQPSAG
jgi:LPS-assembly lipoprotein